MTVSDGSAQYDRFAADYQRTKDAPLRRHVEAYSFMQSLGDVRELRVLDLACGDGYYSRLIRQAGAAHVTGIDISTQMIALAEAQEQSAPLGIEYRCADVTDLAADTAGELQSFDLASAAYLLHYATDESALRCMCASIANCLPSGGRLVAINENPMQPAAADPGYTQYGFNKQFAEPRSEGSTIEYMMVSGREMIRFDVRYYSAATYEAALRDAGFTDITWQPLRLSPDGITECGAEYWQAYLNNPPVVLLEARRA
ncbi:MAG: class I SAM-dependent methyltransferase [Gammaproteobacteria bacterium]|nr:class I SAM-dependent methyltransferase [Gammaproteobacteria bacterium]